MGYLCENAVCLCDLALSNCLQGKVISSEWHNSKKSALCLRKTEYQRLNISADERNGRGHKELVDHHLRVATTTEEPVTVFEVETTISSTVSILKDGETTTASRTTASQISDDD